MLWPRATPMETATPTPPSAAATVAARPAVATVLLSLAVAFLFALTPPTAWDAQTYHLVEAKQALALGKITTPPNIPYFSFPSLVEMLFLAGMVLKGDIAAQQIHFAFLILTFDFLRFYHPKFLSKLPGIGREKSELTERDAYCYYH